MSLYSERKYSSWNKTSTKDILVGRAKIKVIMKDIQGFLGNARFYHIFIKDFSKTAYL